MFGSKDRSSYRGSDRMARSYRSPSPSRGSHHRSRRDSTPDNDCLSNFYRDRFGSRSPDDYINLRLSQFDNVLSTDRVKSTLDRELKALKPVEIKVMRNPEDGTRLVYLNFERPDCAKTVRRKLSSRLRKLLGRRLALDPSGVLRDQEGKYIPDRYHRAAMAAADKSSVSPPRLGRKRTSPGKTFSDKFVKKTNFENLNQDDTRATRTLFVGNLPGDVRESELRRVFEIYGKVENIEIKILSDSKAAFSFILYQTVEEAIKARVSQHDRPVRPGSTKCQIGYGKSQKTARLYVGSLGTWATPEMLMKEFDRFGAIDSLEYILGESHAYIRFVDIDSADDACEGMKNFDLSGNGKNLITVDFAKDDKKGEKRRRGDSDDEDAKRGFRSPSMSPSEAGYIYLVDELREKYPSTWKGLLTLKKIEYPLRLHRVFGKEDLLQDLLRDESGNSLRLNISQRLPLDNAFYQKMMDYDKRDLALMVAPEGDHSTENIVKYLQEKNVAGVININGGVVYILAYSTTLDCIIKFFAPRIAVIKPSSNHLLIAVRKDNNTQQTSVKATDAPVAGFLKAPAFSAAPTSSPIMPSFLPPPPQLPPIILSAAPIPPKLPPFNDNEKANGNGVHSEDEYDEKPTNNLKIKKEYVENSEESN